MKRYNIYISSNEHPRTINTPMMARCYYTKFEVYGIDNLRAKVAELKAQGAVITDIKTDLGTRIWI